MRNFPNKGARLSAMKKGGPHAGPPFSLYSTRGLLAAVSGVALSPAVATFSRGFDLKLNVRAFRWRLGFATVPEKDHKNHDSDEDQYNDRNDRSI